MTSRCMGLMKLTIFMGPPQRGQVRGSTCQMRLIRAAQRRRAVRAAGVGPGSVAPVAVVLARRPRVLFEYTHDRALLEATCTQLLVFDGSGDAKLFHGRYSEWAESKQDQAGRERRSRKTPRKAPVKRRAPTAGGGGMSLGTLERRIEALEIAIRKIDQELLDPAVYTDGPKCNALQAERAEFADELAPLEAEWVRRAEEA